MSSYDAAKKTLPPGTRYSPSNPPPNPPGGQWYDQDGWYSFIGPFIEEVGWKNSIQTDKPFSGTTDNVAARQYKIPMYECPSDRMVQNEWNPANGYVWARWRFNYAVNFGNTNYGQIFQGTLGAGYPAAQFKGHTFMMVKSRPIKNVLDGTSHTLMMAEIRTIKWEGLTWGGPISDAETALGGQTFETTLLPNDSHGDYAEPHRIQGFLRRWADAIGRYRDGRSSSLRMLFWS